MFNAESFRSSDAELSGENLNDSAINQQRGDMVNQAMSEQGERNINEMPLTDLMNIDVKSLSDNELSTYITRLTNESNKLSQQEQAPAQVVEQAPQISENKIAPEVAKATAERVKNDPKANGFLNKKAMAAILAVSITAGGIAGYFGANIQQSSAEPGNDQIRTEQSVEEAFESLTGYDKLDRLIDGSFDQDGNLGCYESDGKVSQNSVGNPNLVLEELGIDPATATPEQRGVVSEYMSYSMKYPAAFDAIAYGAPGFDGLTMNEAEDKIDSMSDEEKAELQEFLQKQYENSEYHTETADGLFENHGVADLENGRHSIAVESDLTGVEVLVRETVLEDGSTVRIMIKEDCNNYVFQIEKTNPDGTKIIKIITPTPVPPTGSEDTGSEGTGTEGTGSEGTGTEGTGTEGTGTEGTGTEGTGTEGTGTEGTGDEGTDIKEKDVENTIRIDEKIDNEIKEDIKTDEIKHNPNPGVTEDTKTDKPTKEEHKGTEPQVVQNNDSKPAEKVQPQKQENNYSENKGGANSKEYAPVKENQEAQKKADANETKVKDAPTSEKAVDDALNDLGID